MAARAGYARQIQRKLMRYVGSARRAIVLEAVDVLRLKAPVDTGHSKNNWIPSIGPPSPIVDGSREQPSAAAQERGIREVQEEPDDSARVANITNNVWYVRFLAEGSSDQAEPGWIQAALAQAIVNARTRLGRLRGARR